MIALIFMLFLNLVFFFFQAEDGIRDRTVTGVQTCALPILARVRSAVGAASVSRTDRASYASHAAAAPSASRSHCDRASRRSEERRVGKEWRARRAQRL